MKIKKKYELIVFTFFMALGMSCIISFITTLVKTGFHADFFGKWPVAWGMSFVIAFPVAYFLPRGIRKVMGKIHFVENEA
ncbi:DUF2798 domain-containing protein [Paenibacillus aestuarii]|uniref:DUF2798 domain-containing protein n=1 Tax=Paenibacillus aestuarii TaxID=516965 RepID=A0ABW0KCY1_9BACL|nr:DUF2798 domain-containing protein [Paenibacillus aestuarii]